MTDSEKREASRQFYQKWVGKGKEDEDDRSYWLDILQRIMGADDATDRVEFQKKVVVDGHTKRIDAYIPETKVIIEQKTLGLALDKKIHQSGGIALTPYEQAKRYNDNLPSSEKARWIVTSNFSDIWIYDMDTRVPEDNITKVSILDLQTHYFLLDFLLEKKVKKVSREIELSQEAGTLVGKIYDAFLKQYNHPDEKKTLESLNILCVRLVFCLYAEDAGLFENKDSFSAYLRQYEPKDMRQALISLFKVLDTPLEERLDMYLSEELEAFPYVNGGLFAKEDIIVPKITQEIKDTLIESSHFNWCEISPTIFGAVFESTLNPQTRRKGGMHYTSIENIHKVIDPLFMDSLQTEFGEITKITVKKTKERKLEELQDKLSKLTFLDPACGSGNFLTETYLSIRRLENDILRELLDGQMMMDNVRKLSIKVSINQFYGLEINDFAADVARTALWIATHQTMRETESIILSHLEFLPLTTYTNIYVGNALRKDWSEIIPAGKLSYIMGNPPFVSQGGSSDRGQRQDGAGRDKEQAEDMKLIFGKEKGTGNLDYVSCWFRKAFEYIKDTSVEVAFVSTNSICQGQQVLPLWKPLFDGGIKINFAHNSFFWSSEANDSAVVYVVIIGYSFKEREEKTLYCYEKYKELSSIKTVNHINPYLLGDAPDIFIDSRSKPICSVNPMLRGGGASDWGHLMLSAEEKDELIKVEPKAEKWIKPFLQGNELIKGIPRYCLWMVGITPNELKSMPAVLERVAAVRNQRLLSKKASTRKKADTAWLFDEIVEITSDSYIAVPQVSSGNRRYIPMDYVSSDCIAGNKLLMIPNGTLYEFGVLCSNVHNAWVRVVASHYGPSYQYSASIAYNNFPWAEANEAQKTKIEKTAQAILDARALYPDSSLAALYDPLTMPKELLVAHRKNDAAVMEIYGLSVKDTSEEDCVAFLMKKYQENVEK